jgi:regulator of protease activity HflC (stomatin/prohibitin superfamily)
MGFSFALGCLFAFLAAGVFVGRFFAKEAGDRAFCTYASSILTAISVGLVGLSMVSVVPAGHVGVVVVLGNVREGCLNEGVHLVHPFAEVIAMSARTHTYTMSSANSEGNVKGDDAIDALSSRGMSMKMDVSVPHRLSPTSASWVYKNLGPNYESEIVRPAISTAVRQAVSQFTEEEIYATKRTELVEVMRDRLNTQIRNIVGHYGKNAPKEPIVFPEVQLRNVILPPSVTNAINEKIATEQKIIQAQNEAKRKKVEAEGIQTFQDIVSRGITPDLLRWKGIEATVDLATSNNAKVIIIGNSKDGLPVVLSEDTDSSPKGR